MTVPPVAALVLVIAFVAFAAVFAIANWKSRRTP
jgi:hypothetical protein